MEKKQNDKLHSYAVYYPGLTIFKRQNVLIEWGLNDRIIVTDQNSGLIVIDAALEDIQRASVAATQLVMKVDGKKYRFDLAGLGGIVGPLSGKFGLWNWFDAVKRSDVNKWSAALQKAGVSMGQTDPVRPFKLGIKIGFGIFAVISVVAIIAISIHEFS